VPASRPVTISVVCSSRLSPACSPRPAIRPVGHSTRCRAPHFLEGTASLTERTAEFLLPYMDSRCGDPGMGSTRSGWARSSATTRATDSDGDLTGNPALANSVL